MDIGVLYKVNKVTDSNYLGYNLSPYGKWIYYEYAKNDNGTALPSYIPGHTTTTSNPNGVAIAGGDTFSAQVAGAIQEGIWSQLTDNGVVDWPATGWGSPTDPTNAYNTVSAAESWSSHFQSNDDPTFATYENAIGIAQLQLTADGVTQDEQNQNGYDVCDEPRWRAADPRAGHHRRLVAAGGCRLAGDEGLAAAGGVSCRREQGDKLQGPS